MDSLTGHQATQSEGSEAPSLTQAEPVQEQDHSKRQKKSKKRKLKQRGPLHGEPLSTHPIEVKLTRIREAIAAGADVNGLDDSEPECHREGRPLDACLRVTHMAHGATFYSNDQVIQLLLEHGADPRLRDKKYNIFTPLERATYGAEKDWEAGGNTKAKPFYEKVLAMFQEAIAKLEEKEKDEKGDDQKFEAGQEENGQDGAKATIAAPSDETSFS